MDINEKIYVGVYEVAKDFDISKQKAYQIIKQLNKQLKDNCPKKITLLQVHLSMNSSHSKVIKLKYQQIFRMSIHLIR